MGILVRVLSYFPSFPFPLLLSSLFPRFFLFPLCRYIYWTRQKRNAGQGYCCPLEKHVRLWSGPALLSSGLCFRSGIYLCEQKTKLSLLLLFFPKRSFFSVSPITFWLWVPPSTLLRKIAYRPSAPTQPNFRASVRKPKGHLKMAVECQEASQLCGSCHLREVSAWQLTADRGRGKRKTEGRSQALH